MKKLIILLLILFYTQQVFSQEINSLDFNKYSVKKDYNINHLFAIDVLTPILGLFSINYELGFMENNSLRLGFSYHNPSLILFKNFIHTSYTLEFSDGSTKKIDSDFHLYLSLLQYNYYYRSFPKNGYIGMGLEHMLITADGYDSAENKTSQGIKPFIVLGSQTFNENLFKRFEIGAAYEVPFKGYNKKGFSMVLNFEIGFGL